ncbi:MAG: branched-chain amino acid ABC transporter permease [Thaumarchaeota archaeon]|nr:MAG: branched-chain amino acid ABC transporter permease [Nitrososphaerota archaeon]
MAFDVIGLLISVATVYGIFALLSLSLNLEYGYGGQPNFGQVLFYGIGAFSAGLVSATLLPLLAGRAVGDVCSTGALVAREAISASDPLLAVSTWLIALVVAALLASIFGFLASYPALRVKEEWYLSMILLVGAEMFRVIVRNTPQFGCGYNGLPGISNPFGWISSNSNSPLLIDLSTGLYAIAILGFAALSYFGAQRFANSPYGRLLKSVRDDRILSESLGKDVKKVREQIMMIGSAMAGLAGALYVFYIGVAIAEDYIASVTFSIWVMIVLGGIANNRGALVGTIALICLQKGTQIVGVLLQQASIAVDSNLLIYLDYMVEAAILLLLILYRPKGLIPEQAVKTVAYRSFDSDGKDQKHA